MTFFSHIYNGFSPYFWSLKYIFRLRRKTSFLMCSFIYRLGKTTWIPAYLFSPYFCFIHWTIWSSNNWYWWGLLSCQKLPNYRSWDHKQRGALNKSTEETIPKNIPNINLNGPSATPTFSANRSIRKNLNPTWFVLKNSSSMIVNSLMCWYIYI